MEHSELALFELEKQINKEMKEKQASKQIAFYLGSISDKEILQKIFSRNSVDMVFHAAAYKHVPIVESNETSGFKNNYIGTKIIYDFCVKQNVKDFVLVSTDKAVRPTNVMGATKRLCELYCLVNSNKNQMNLLIVRFGNVFGSSGSVLNEFKKQVSAGGPILVTDPKIERYFMSKKRLHHF